MSNKIQQYSEEVMSYLEYLNYPEYVDHFEPEPVAHTIWNVIKTFHELNQSPRICALSIFGLTWWKLKEGIGIVKQQVN